MNSSRSVNSCFITITCFLLASLSFAQSHPLDPLSKEEITAVTETLKASGKITESSRFSTMVLHEPPKAEVLNFKPGDSFRREAFVVVYERTVNKTFAAIVDLNKKSVASFKEIPGVQPSFMLEDVILLTSITRKDPQ